MAIDEATLWPADLECEGRVPCDDEPDKYPCITCYARRHFNTLLAAYREQAAELAAAKQEIKQRIETADRWLHHSLQAEAQEDEVRRRLHAQFDDTANALRLLHAAEEERDAARAQLAEQAVEIIALRSQLSGYKAELLANDKYSASVCAESDAARAQLADCRAALGAVVAALVAILDSWGHRTTEAAYLCGGKRCVNAAVALARAAALLAADGEEGGRDGD